MSNYFYKAVNEEGRKVRGKVPSDSQEELASTLKLMGLELISCKLEKKHSSFTFLGGIRQNDLISMFIHLEQLDRAGISILESIDDLKESSDNPAIKDLMHEIYDLLKNGSLLSESLAKYPKIWANIRLQSIFKLVFHWNK